MHCRRVKQIAACLTIATPWKTHRKGGARDKGGVRGRVAAGSANGLGMQDGRGICVGDAARQHLGGDKGLDGRHPQLLVVVRKEAQVALAVAQVVAHLGAVPAWGVLKVCSGPLMRCNEGKTGQ